MSLVEQVAKEEGRLGNESVVVSFGVGQDGGQDDQTVLLQEASLRHTVAARQT